MGVRILYDRDQDLAALYCSTSEISFGCVFTKSDEHEADERAMAFLRWLATCDTWKRYEKHVTRVPRDVRQLTDDGLLLARLDWLRQEAEQWALEAQDTSD